MFYAHVHSGARTGHGLLDHCLQKYMYTFIMQPPIKKKKTEEMDEEGEERQESEKKVRQDGRESMGKIHQIVKEKTPLKSYFSVIGLNITCLFHPLKNLKSFQVT